VPAVVLDMTQLTELSMNDNPLKRLSKRELGGLTRLKKLYLERCKLVKLPRCVNKLGRLTKLFISENRLCTLPPLTNVSAGRER
jgi:Leucine-rich repeat (LRR) protein